MLIFRPLPKYYEFVDGVPIRLKTESLQHQIVLNNFMEVLHSQAPLREYVVRDCLPTQLFSENGCMETPKADTTVHMRIPDIVVVHEAFYIYYFDCVNHCENCFLDCRICPVPIYRRFSVSSTMFPAKMHIEIASSETYETDTEQKWREYAISGVPIYLIYEMPEVSTDGEPHVVCGSLWKFHGNSLRSWNGKAHTWIGCMPPNCDVELLQRLYYKTTFKSDVRLSISLLTELFCTVRDLLDPKLFEQHSNQ